MACDHLSWDHTPDFPIERRPTPPLSHSRPEKINLLVKSNPELHSVIFLQSPSIVWAVLLSPILTAAHHIIYWDTISFRLKVCIFNSFLLHRVILRGLVGNSPLAFSPFAVTLVLSYLFDIWGRRLMWQSHPPTSPHELRRRIILWETAERYWRQSQRSESRMSPLTWCKIL